MPPHVESGGSGVTFSAKAVQQCPGRHRIRIATLNVRSLCPVTPGPDGRFVVPTRMASVLQLAMDHEWDVVCPLSKRLSLTSWLSVLDWTVAWGEEDLAVKAPTSGES